MWDGTQAIVMYNEFRKSVAHSLFVKRDEIEAELLRAAKLIRDNANQLIAKEDAIHHRKPPCASPVKADGRPIGPRIVWMRYSTRKYDVKDRGKFRFTQGILGCVNDNIGDPFFRLSLRPSKRRLESVKSWLQICETGSVIGVQWSRNYIKWHYK